MVETPEDSRPAGGVDDPLAVLEGFGLSGYLAKAYLALLELGPAQAREVSERSGVPQGRVYDVLEKLHQQGLAEVLPEAPRRYRAVPFEVFIERELHRHRERVATLERDKDALLATMASRGGQPGPERGEYLVVRGRKAMLERIAGIAASAQADCLMLGTERTPMRLRAHGTFQDLAARGVHARLLVPVSPENAEGVREVQGQGVEVRHLGGFRDTFPPGLHVIVGDGTRAMLFQHIPDDMSTVRGEDVALYIEHPEMVRGLKGLAESLWTLAMPAAERLDEMVRGVPSAEPGKQAQSVLIVDDEPDILQSLKELIDESLGAGQVRILTASNGTEGLALLHGEPVDLIITDYRMPGMNGLEFLERAAKEVPGAQRILITAFPDLKVAIKAINEAGVERFLTKPFQSAEVVEVIRAVLSERGEQALRNYFLQRAVEPGAKTP